MKKRKYMILCLLISLFFGCQSHEQISTNELTQKRIQIQQNASIDYLSYLQDPHDGNISYTTIDTSHLGTHEIRYYFNDNSKQDIGTLTVDVVRMYDHNIFNPEDVKPSIVNNPEDITVLVNKCHAIKEDWVPNDLVNVIDSHQQLRKEAADAYKEFYLAAKEKKIDIYAISGYRTNDLQTLYWKNQVNAMGEAHASLYSAYPGRSEHQLGLAIDVSYKTTGDRLNEDVEDSEIGKFIVSDAYRYGFILRYPKDKISITNYGYEPWHIRYVGKELAKYLHDNDMTLEEYYDEI